MARKRRQSSESASTSPHAQTPRPFVLRSRPLQLPPAPDVVFSHCWFDVGDSVARTHAQQLTSAGFRAAEEYTRLYKYQDPEFARMMIEEGRLRVGTLDYYRQWDDARRGDQDEGTLQFDAGGGVNVGAGMDPLTRKAVQTFTGLHALDLDRAAVMDSRVRAREIHQNCWVYCTAHEFSGEASGGRSACVEIVEPGEFFGVISTALAAHLDQELGAHTYGVAYRERVARGDDFGRLSSAFVKPPRFAFESEVRGIWLSDPLPGQAYVDLVVPELPPLLRLVAVPPPSRVAR